MPMYEYECGGCGSRFEQIRKFSDPPVEVCPSCGARKVQKLLSSPAIQFKGSGWYITDYARKGAPDGDAKSAESKDKSAESKDTKSAPETKSPTADSASAPSASGSSGSTTSTPSAKNS